MPSITETAPRCPATEPPPARVVLLSEGSALSTLGITATPAARSWLRSKIREHVTVDHRSRNRYFALQDIDALRAEIYARP